MREIKFRGKRIDNGQYIYGYLIQKFSNFRVAKSYIYHNLVMHEVDPESVAQLVGHDFSGKEVYEGDTVLRYDSEAEFKEAPENGVLREVILYTQVNPDLESYYCILKENQS